MRTFDIDDELIENFEFDNLPDKNILTITFKRSVKHCEICGSVNGIWSKGFYTTTLTGCPTNAKPTLIVCRLRKYICKQCGSYFVEKNPIAYRNTNMTSPTILAMLKEFKHYTTTYSKVARDYGLSTSQVINLFDRYVRVKENVFLEFYYEH